MKAKQKLKSSKKTVKALKPDVEPLEPTQVHTPKEGGMLLDIEQPLFFFGAPPALKALYKTNTGYDKDFHPKDMIIQLQHGHSPAEIAASWGISAAEFNNWISTYPDMGQAKAIGATAYEAYYKRALRLTAFGQIRGVKEQSLHKLLDNQVGFHSDGGGHEFADVQGATVTFVDGDGKDL